MNQVPLSSRLFRSTSLSIGPSNSPPVMQLRGDVPTSPPVRPASLTTPLSGQRGYWSYDPGKAVTPRRLLQALVRRLNAQSSSLTSRLRNSTRPSWLCTPR
jgi:hypothetical protein